MSPRRLLSFAVPALIITLAIAVSAQAPPATTFNSASDSNVLTNKSVMGMVSAKLSEEIIITKIQTTKTKFDLPTPALVEVNSSGVVSANVVKAMMTRTLRHDAGVTSL
jgi:hypothetical protein